MTYFCCLELWFMICLWFYIVLSSSDKEEPDAEAVSSMLGFQSYWDAAYADELANFREHGHTGEVWWAYNFFCGSMVSPVFDTIG